MSRKHRLTPTPVYPNDTLLPVEQLPSLKEDDCFGKEWRLDATDCAICADANVCAIVFRQQMKPEEKALTDAHGPFLDSTVLPKDEVLLKLAEKVAEKQRAGEPLTVERLTQFLMTNLIKTKDTRLAELTIQRMIDLCPSVYVEGGNLLSKEA